MVGQFGLNGPVMGMSRTAEESVRRVIDVLTDGSYLPMDNGQQVSVKVSIDRKHGLPWWISPAQAGRGRTISTRLRGVPPRCCMCSELLSMMTSHE